MLDIAIPQLPPVVKTWLLNYKPDPDARQWMKFGSPINFGRIIDTFRDAWHIDGGLLDSLAKRIVTDASIRLGREYADIGTPEFKALKCLSPDFAFDYQAQDIAIDKTLQGKWRIGVQETTLDHLVWAARQGSTAAISVAAATFLAYYNNAKWPYLRTGGNDKLPYMDRGRCRTARGCLAYCRGMLTILCDVLNMEGGKEIDFLKSLMIQHISRIHANWPLVDAPAGDHLPVPFMSFYQTASLFDEVVRCYGWYDGDAGSSGYEVLEWIRDMVSACRAGGPPGSWYYDVAIVDNKPTWHEDMAKRVTTVTGTAAWAVDLVGDVNSTYAIELEDQARAAKWPETRPDLMAQFFGTVK